MLRGSHLLALTNTVDSSIARKADAQLYTRCGPEISVDQPRNLAKSVTVE